MTSTPTAWLFTFSVKAAHHVERDVGLEQRAPHLAQRGVDVGFGQRAAPREPVENAAKPIGQAFEHACTQKRPEHSKHFGARGRIALSGGDLRSPGPVGKTEFTALLSVRGN